MAMELNVGRSNTTRTTGDDSWKSQYFINFSLPAQTSSGKLPIDGVGLKVSIPEQKQLIEFLLADAANVDKLRKNLVITFRDMGVAPPTTVVTIPGVTMPTLEAMPVDEAKPQGYLNIGCPLSDGTVGQIGFIALREKVPAHRIVLAILRGGADNVKALTEALMVEFRSATPAKRQFAFA